MTQNDAKKIASITTVLVVALSLAVTLPTASAFAVTDMAKCKASSGGATVECETSGPGACAAGAGQSGSHVYAACFAADYGNGTAESGWAIYND